MKSPHQSEEQIRLDHCLPVLAKKSCSITLHPNIRNTAAENITDRRTVFWIIKTFKLRGSAAEKKLQDVQQGPSQDHLYLRGYYRIMLPPVQSLLYISSRGSAGLRGALLFGFRVSPLQKTAAGKL
ncbi:hypothetical protein XENORESO_017421 [Xenotaenia resolanae]|uniref:Uncharacterized protein n=1 Tax=Xenotaenia resolanae TaxID=208358 RepID=A0ABV0X4W2_9TELE